MELALRGRLLDPERLEQREFLALGLAGVDREAPRRQSVDFSLCDRAEIAGAEKDADLVVIVGLVDRRVQPKAGETQIYRRGSAAAVLPKEK